MPKLNQCSPSHFDNFESSGTCYSYKELHTIAKLYNNTHHDIPLKIPRSKRALLDVLQKTFRNTCKDSQLCWTSLNFINASTKKELVEAFRPLRPKEWYSNSRTWLNTYDILFVMKQYEIKYKKFSFLGVFPIDFEERNESGICNGEQMCDFDIQRDILDKGKTQFGLVINTDPHDKSGQHWFSIFCGLDPKLKNFGIYYYDSVASPPEKRMNIFMQNIKEQVNKKFYPSISQQFQVEYNKVRRQYKNTECGMFSIIFLTQCLKNLKFKFICEKMYTDDMVNSFRKQLYANNYFLENNSVFTEKT